MKNPAQWADRLTTAALPLAFLGSGFLNILVFPLGLHHYDTARKLVTFGILGAAALFLFCRVALLYAKAPELRRLTYHHRKETSLCRFHPSSRPRPQPRKPDARRP